MKIRHRLAVSTTAAVLAIGAFAPSAMAANFYIGPLKCYVGNGLYAQLTAYDSNGGTDTTIHHAQKANGIDGYYRYRIVYDGYIWPGVGTGDKGHSGSLADGYQIFESPTADHVVTFVWRRSSGATTQCSIPVTIPG